MMLGGSPIRKYRLSEKSQSASTQQASTAPENKMSKVPADVEFRNIRKKKLKEEKALGAQGFVTQEELNFLFARPTMLNMYRMMVNSLLDYDTPLLLEQYKENTFYQEGSKDLPTQQVAYEKLADGLSLLSDTIQFNRKINALFEEFEAQVQKVRLRTNDDDQYALLEDTIDGLREGKMDPLLARKFAFDLHFPVYIDDQSSHAREFLEKVYALREKFITLLTEKLQKNQ